MCPQRMTDKCFRKCIGKPGGSLDNSEQVRHPGNPGMARGAGSGAARRLRDLRVRGRSLLRRPARALGEERASAPAFVQPYWVILGPWDPDSVRNTLRALQKCIAMCMDRYMDAWNTVSRAYNSRLQRERANM